jgi:16S rRNA processing protein RimM
MSDEALVVLGYIMGPHGVRGAVKVRSACEPASAIFNYRPWLLRTASGERLETTAKALSAKSANEQIARLDAIEDRDVAALWQGAEICVARAALPDLAPDEYYWTDLVGLTVRTESGVTLGTIHHLFATGSNDVMVIHGDRERLVPYLPGQCVKHIDLAERTMVVDWDADF